MELLELNNSSAMMILQTILVGVINLLVPFVFVSYNALRNAILTIVPVIFLVNVLNLDRFYLQGGRCIYTLFSMGGYEISLYLEGISLIFLTLVAFLWVLSMLYTIAYFDRRPTPKFTFFYSLAIISASMAALSANLVTFFIFYEILTLSTIPLIAYNGSSHTYKALKKYVTILILASLVLMLPAIIIIDVTAGSTAFTKGGILMNKVSPMLTIMLFLMIIFGMAKAGLILMHMWIPSAMVASYPVSGLLHAVAVVKVGLFGIYKCIVYIFGINYLFEIFNHNNWVMIFPIITILYSSVMCLIQDTVKKLLAYSTIAQLNMALLSSFSFTNKGIIAGVMHLISHSLSKVTLFFAAGLIYKLTSKAKIHELEGIQESMPKTYYILLFALLSLIGIPPMAGFYSKYYMFEALTDHYRAILVLCLSTLFTAIYGFRIIYLGIGEMKAGENNPDLNKEQSIKHKKYNENGLMLYSIIITLIACLTFSYLLPLIEQFMQYI